MMLISGNPNDLPCIPLTAHLSPQTPSSVHYRPA